jgi:hypothetical protein
MKWQKQDVELVDFAGRQFLLEMIAQGVVDIIPLIGEKLGEKHV